jgi:hypothetical protein
MGLFDGSSARKQSQFEFDAYNKLAQQNQAAAAAQTAMLQGQLGAGRDAALGQYAGLEGRLAGQAERWLCEQHHGGSSGAH